MEEFNMEIKRQSFIVKKMIELTGYKASNNHYMHQFTNLLSLCKSNHSAVLGFAVMRNQLEYAKMLIEAGANVKLPVHLEDRIIPNILLLTVETPENSAPFIPIEKLEMVELLLDAGAEITALTFNLLEELFLKKIELEVMQEIKNV
jgi:hypothetical protein